MTQHLFLLYTNVYMKRSLHCPTLMKNSNSKLRFLQITYKKVLWMLQQQAAYYQ